MDGWSNNSSYTSGTTSSGGWGNSGSSATSKGYGSSSSDYSSYSSDDSGYWSNQYGGSSAANDPANQKGVYASPTAQQYLYDAAKAKRMTSDEVSAAKGMIAGKQAAQGQKVMGDVIGAAGSVIGGPVGALAAKGVSWAAGKGIDALNEYGDTPSYQQSKKMSQDDTSLIGNAIRMAAPKGIGVMAQTAYDDKTGDYNQYVNGLERTMKENGYIGNNKPASIQQSGSGGSAPNSLLANMYQTQQQPAEAYNYEQPLLNYDNNASYYRGSVY